jgi:hypothetical protein
MASDAANNHADPHLGYMPSHWQVARLGNHADPTGYTATMASDAANDLCRPPRGEDHIIWLVSDPENSSLYSKRLDVVLLLT